MNEALEQAYAAGDHRTARRLARELLSSRHSEPIAEPLAEEELARARRVLIETTPDLFLAVVGVLGLGLVAWLVYNFVL